MADAVIKIEKDFCEQQGNDKTWADWKVPVKEKTGKGAYIFRFAPADDTPVTIAQPGPFVSVPVRLEAGRLHGPRRRENPPTDHSHRRLRRPTHFKRTTQFRQAEI